MIDPDVDSEPLTYNQWFESDLHMRYVLPLLRKRKLKNIEKAS